MLCERSSTLSAQTIELRAISQSRHNNTAIDASQIDEDILSYTSRRYDLDDLSSGNKVIECKSGPPLASFNKAARSDQKSFSRLHCACLLSLPQQQRILLTRNTEKQQCRGSADSYLEYPAM
jgi:hypothetical protein